MKSFLKKTNSRIFLSFENFVGENIRATSNTREREKKNWKYKQYLEIKWKWKQMKK